MNPIEELEKRLDDRPEGIVLTIEPPVCTDPGFWFLNVSGWGPDVRVEWSPECGFTIVNLAAVENTLDDPDKGLIPSDEVDRVFARVLAIVCPRRHLQAVSA